jgi:hypothetical protein
MTLWALGFPLQTDVFELLGPAPSILGTLSQMPSIINLFRKPSCSGNWQEAVSITRTIATLARILPEVRI